MRQFFIIIGKYGAPYKVYVFLNLFLNIVQTIFSVVSFALLIPFLGILFKTQDRILDKPELGISMSSAADYFNYAVSSIIEEEGEMAALLYVSLFILTTIFLKNLFQYMANTSMSVVRNAVIRDMRNELYNKFLKLPLSYYNNTQKGGLIARFTTDIQTIEQSIIALLVMVFRDPVAIIISLYVLVTISGKLTVVIFLFLIVIGGIIGWIGKSLKQVSAETQEKLGVIISVVEETIGGLRIVKAFTAENKMNKRLSSLTQEHYSLLLKAALRNNLSSPVSEFLGVCLMIAVMYYGGQMVLGDDSVLKPEKFIGYMIIFSQIIEPAKSLSRSYYNLQKGLASYDRVEEVLRTPNTLKDTEGTKEIHSFKGNIELKNVSFSYGDAEVLKNINLKIEKGKTVALVGQSGSGKSTLVDLIPRFYDVTEGEILVDGVNIKEVTLESLRSLMGNVNQESILFNDTIFNNIAFGVKNATLETVTEAAKVANAHDFICETPLGYDTNIGDRGGKLSGGQRQRISIARAVLKDPALLILDEATSALDTESEKLVQDALENLLQNRTSIVIAHRLSTIRSVDEICVMQEGKIVERGTHDELITLNRVYKKLHTMQTL